MVGRMLWAYSRWDALTDEGALGWLTAKGGE
jgi:hypothetical protein